MEKEMKSPRCSRVVLVDSTRTAQGHTVFKFSIDAEHAITGFIEKTEGDNYMIWRRISAHRRNPAIGTLGR